MSAINSNVLFIGTCWVVSVVFGTSVLAWALVKFAKLLPAAKQLTSDGPKHHPAPSKQSGYPGIQVNRELERPAGPVETPKIQLDPAMFKRNKKLDFGDKNT